VRRGLLAARLVAVGERAIRARDGLYGAIFHAWERDKVKAEYRSLPAVGRGALAMP